MRTHRIQNRVRVEMDDLGLTTVTEEDTGHSVILNVWEATMVAGAIGEMSRQLPVLPTGEMCGHRYRHGAHPCQLAKGHEGKHAVPGCCEWE